MKKSNNWIEFAKEDFIVAQASLENDAREAVTVLEEAMEFVAKKLNES